MENGNRRIYSIGELAEAAGISTRTVRYYVSEGLLPPPVGAGPHTRYTEAHLAQLAVIADLKAQYLPLKEIRRRLIGQTAPYVPLQTRAERSRLQADSPAPAAAPPAAKRSYMRYRTDPAAAQAELDGPLYSVAESPPVEAMLRKDLRSAPLADMHLAAEMALPPPEPVTWRRILITDEAELVITTDLYERHQDKIDWLVQWATRVLE